MSLVENFISLSLDEFFQFSLPYGRLHVVTNQSLSKLRQENPPQPPGATFLITSHCRQDTRAGQLAQVNRQTKSREQGFKAISRSLPGNSQSLAKTGGENHSDSNSLSVQEPAIALGRLNSMGKRMAKIKDHPQTGFSLIFLNDLGLDPHTALNDLREQRRRTGKESRPLPLNERQQPDIPNRRGLDNLGPAGTRLAIRQSFEQVEIHEDSSRLMESSGEVFSFRNIDPGLSPYTGIDHGQQRGWNLDELYSTQKAGGCVACNVSDNPSPEGYHAGVTVAPGANSGTKNPLHLLHRLRALSWNERGFGKWNASTPELLSYHLAMVP